MNESINIYCDESCHIQHDHQKVMLLGAIWCPEEKVNTLSNSIRSIKKRHGLIDRFEIKWTKVSPGAIDFYLDVIALFLNEEDLHFRVLVVPNKELLDHERFCQTHDDWYYKMYFDMLKTIFNPKCQYNIYIDIKDSRGGEKVKKLHEVLSNSIYDFSQKIIRKVQIIRSDEIELMQLADLLIGAVSYVNRGLNSSDAKLAIISEIKKQTGYSLTRSTLYREEKLNILIWQAT